MLGSAAAAQVWLSCGVRECNHQVETDPAELSQRYDLDTPVLEWRERLVCSRCGRRDVDFVVSGTKEAVSATGGCERNGQLKCARIGPAMPNCKSPQFAARLSRPTTNSPVMLIPV
jgi:hypothetical protein